jgi:hypothetical protein
MQLTNIEGRVHWYIFSITNDRYFVGDITVFFNAEFRDHGCCHYYPIPFFCGGYICIFVIGSALTVLARAKAP